MERAWQSTGEAMPTPSGNFDRIPAYDKRTGEHLWVMAGCWKIDPARLFGDDKTVTPMLDVENMLSLQGPGCYYCEQPYSRSLSTRRCKGRP